MKNKTGRQKKNDRQWEQKAIFFMIGLVGVLAAVCIFLTVCITIESQKFSSTLTNIQAYGEEGNDRETKNTEEMDQTSDSSSSQSSAPEILQLPPASTLAQGMGAAETVPPVETIPAENQSQQGVTRYIFVGDSRYVAMSQFAQPEDYFIADVGMGYEFLVRQLDAVRAAAIPGSVVIIGLGVNDPKPEKYESYIRTINELSWTLGVPVYYMLVNPVDESVESQNGYGIKNDQINAFNAALQAGLDASVHIIDTNSFLKYDGYVTTDGLHYDDNTYLKIYQYIKAQIQAG